MPLALTLLTLAVMNVWVHAGPRRAQLVTGPAAAAFLLAVGRAAGLSWDQLGLGPGWLTRGARWGGLCAGIVVAAFAVVLAVPPAHRFFRDVRYRLGIGSALTTALLTVPLGTVVFEEVAFRGVLWGLVADAQGPVWATAATSLLFGAWHVLPALDLARTNTALAGSGRRTKLVATVLGTVAFTAAAGVLFAELRRHSGSLLAPVLLHWATNAAGVLGSAIVWAWTADPPDRAAEQPARTASRRRGAASIPQSSGADDAARGRSGDSHSRRMGVPRGDHR